MSDEIVPIEPDPKHFNALISALNDGVERQGKIEALWAEDRLYPRTFDVLSSDHPWVRPGDKIIIVAGSERPQG